MPLNDPPIVETLIEKLEALEAPYGDSYVPKQAVLSILRQHEDNLKIVYAELQDVAQIIAAQFPVVLDHDSEMAKRFDAYCMLRDTLADFSKIIRQHGDY